MKVRNGYLDLSKEPAWRDEFAEVFTARGATGVLLSGDHDDLGFLAGIPGLQGVSFLRGIRDASGVAAVPGLQELSLPADYSGPLDLSGLTGLESLSMPYSPAVASLPALTRLRSLMIWFWPKRVGLDVLGPKPELTELRLEFKRGVSLSSAALATAPKLRKLSLYNGELTDVDGLSGLADMREMSFFGTKIGRIDFVAGMPRLFWLWLEKCGDIADIEALRGHTSVKHLTLTGVQIISGDLSPLLDLPAATGIGIHPRYRHYSHELDEVSRG
ncbi:hypothetical protein DMH04_48910 [Kibdelosporangium aridum]|uniref:Leucine-rich repeat domain-containing protein n=1 Tax=Kibdelosporangium aridum TaxID=2030 RepID=A0A428YIY2_KIBAR|nr:leucine-rich repeat domain-containing protein [Kibdelosporangium aridum]RSM67516.1 hypothetical protein DMH04_48910 [Kibdelosporangium aridum]